jgi:hypothetical protein
MSVRALARPVPVSAQARVPVLLLAAVCVWAGCVRPPAPGFPPPLSENLRAARALDQQGVVAFEAGRYRDALLYFQAALAHGGPSSERWNAAKCELRLDEPEKADTELVAYLAMTDLSTDDRRDGDALLGTIRRRPSPLTVLSNPLGAGVVIDGRRAGVTPVTVSVAPGDHTVAVQLPQAKDERVVNARYGRAILVEAHP